MFINTFKKLNNFLVSEKILVQKFPSGSAGDGRVDRRGWGDNVEPYILSCWWGDRVESCSEPSSAAHGGDE